MVCDCPTTVLLQSNAQPLSKLAADGIATELGSELAK